MANGIFDSNVTGTPAVSATGTNGADGIDVTCDSGNGVTAQSTDGTGILAQSFNGIGLHAVGGGAFIATPLPIKIAAILAEGGSNVGIYSSSSGDNSIEGHTTDFRGVYGESTNDVGVYGESTNGTGILAQSHNGIGLRVVGGGAGLGVPPVSQAGIIADGGENIGVYGISSTFIGVSGESDTSIGVIGRSSTGSGVEGISTTSIGVLGDSTNGPGVLAQSFNGIGLHAVVGGVSIANPPSQVAIFADGGENIGVYGISTNNNAIVGSSNFGTGVDGNGGQFGVRGRSEHIAVQGISSNGLAGKFLGNVDVQGTLTKSGGGFKIDHPLDPENKYLSHSFVESPDMLNVYNGNVTTDANGDATIMLPDYFETLNQDFRYQLTVIGQFAQAIVAEEVRNNRFMIKTDQPNVRVSWHVTGVRKDHFANMYRILVEEDKSDDERGMYLHPEAHGKPETQSIEYAHEKRLKGP
jgi:hypothetical protein